MDFRTGIAAANAMRVWGRASVGARLPQFDPGRSDPWTGVSTDGKPLCVHRFARGLDLLAEMLRGLHSPGGGGQLVVVGHAQTDRWLDRLAGVAGGPAHSVASRSE